MLRINLICVGRLKEDYWRAAEKEYLKRLAGYAGVCITEIPETICMDENKPACVNRTKVLEGKKILDCLDKGDFLIALDLSGKQFSSEEWADWLKNETAAGRSRLSMVIGGSYGLSGEVLQRAGLIWSFSRLTFPHQMMRILVLEQLYRGFKIARNEKYHK